MIARFAIPFFFVMSLVVVPLVLTLLCRWLLPRRWRRPVVAVLVLLLWGTVAYGYFVGFRQIEVHQVEFVSSDLPEAFDGYRIVQFSDAHVGTLTGSRQQLLRRAIDTINAQQPDALVFTGDLQNVWPNELEQQIPLLSRLHAKDGVFSVLGNHDYAVYQDCDTNEKKHNCQLTCQAERQMGWTLLNNAHRIIRRDSDSLVIAGMENWGVVKRMPRRGDVQKTLAGLTLHHPSPTTHHPFIVMLQHDPSCWREKILPECHAQLTLSGHTHGGQVSLFGWSPVSLTYGEWGGATYEGDRAIYVSTGLGGLIPFRLGLPGEIVVITLKTKKIK